MLRRRMAVPTNGLNYKRGVNICRRYSFFMPVEPACGSSSSDEPQEPQAGSDRNRQQGPFNQPLPLDVLSRPAERWSRADRRRLTKISTDLRLPHETFPLARSMQRTIHAHVGPTNSGKTHHALAALSAASSGVYCGPLRLLAFEIHDRLNGGNVPCTLRTGQEMIEVENANHTAWCGSATARRKRTGGCDHPFAPPNVQCSLILLLRLSPSILGNMCHALFSRPLCFVSLPRVHFVAQHGRDDAHAHASGGRSARRSADALAPGARLGVVARIARTARFGGARLLAFIR